MTTSENVSNSHASIARIFPASCCRFEHMYQFHRGKRAKMPCWYVFSQEPPLCTQHIFQYVNNLQVRCLVLKNLTQHDSNTPPWRFPHKGQFAPISACWRVVIFSPSITDSNKSSVLLSSAILVCFHSPSIDRFFFLPHFLLHFPAFQLRLRKTRHKLTRIIFHVFRRLVSLLHASGKPVRRLGAGGVTI